MNVEGVAFNATAINVQWSYPPNVSSEYLGGRLTGHRVSAFVYVYLDLFEIINSDLVKLIQF